MAVVSSKRNASEFTGNRGRLRARGLDHAKWPGDSFPMILPRPFACGFAAAVAAAAPAQTPAWPDPVANHVLPYETSGLTHGPLLGAITSRSVRVWVRTAKPGAFRVRHGMALPLTRESASVAGETTAERDNTGVVELTGLAPGTRHYYAVQIGDLDAFSDLRLDHGDPWPSFTTPPEGAAFADAKLNPKGLFNFTFSTSFCASQEAETRSGGQWASTPGYDTLLREHGGETLFHVYNGDTIYEELRDGTREGIRANYKLYLNRGRSLSRLGRMVPAFHLFDDHEIAWDLHGAGEVGLKAGRHLMRDPGVAVFQEYFGWANPRGPQSGPVRFGTAQLVAGSDVLHDPAADFSKLTREQAASIHIGPYTPSRNGGPDPAPPRNAGVHGLVEVIDAHRLRVKPAFTATENAAYSVGAHHYCDWQVANVHFLALDVRSERSRFDAKKPDDPRFFALGEAQRQWLMRQMRESQAAFFVLFSSAPWTLAHTAAHVNQTEAGKLDKGDGLFSRTHERELLFKFFAELRKPVLLFSGDLHTAAAVRVARGLWEFLPGPMGSTGHPLSTAGDPPSGGLFDSNGRKVEVRWTSLNPNNVPYQRQRGAFYGVVQVNNVMPGPRPDGPGYQWSAHHEPTITVRFHDAYTGRLVYAETISTMDAR